MYWEVPEAIKQKMVEVAKEFRKQPTASEAILWQALRGKKLDGHKFRRQQPIGAFIVDFFCASKCLIVEVDGQIHDSQQERDRDRQQLLESLGLRFIRVTSEEVETNLTQTLSKIHQALNNSAPHPLTPSPPVGEGGQDSSPTLAPLSLNGLSISHIFLNNPETLAQQEFRD